MKRKMSITASGSRILQSCLSGIMWSMKSMDWEFTVELKNVEVDKVLKDYIKIEYRDGSNLYILATQLDALQKYSGADTARAPKLNKLGTQEWNRTKSKVKGRCQKYRQELVELYAVRQEKRGGMCVARIQCGKGI